MKKLLVILSALIVGGCAADGASFSEPSIGILAARPNLSLVEKDTCAFEMTKTKLSN